MATVRRMVRKLGLVIFGIGIVTVQMALLGPAAPGEVGDDIVLTLTKFPGGRDMFGLFAFVTFLVGLQLVQAKPVRLDDQIWQKREPTRPEPHPLSPPGWEEQRRIGRYDSWS